ncbi:hypothetical protein Gpo141_00003643 [Globisporangium polare]
MHRYETLEQLGNGSFGEVVKARSRKTNEVVAIKKMKALFPTWEECLQLRELKSLRVLRHENIVQLKEVIQDKEELYFVFEYMHSSLCKVMRQIRHQAPVSGSDEASGAAPAPVSSWLSEAQIRSIMYQLFCGLAHMHKHGFFHRDIKPENLLCHDETLKIADLGQAREIRSRPPYTDYVATRWYRSPELLLRATTYNSPIDLWACGCIMAELFLQAPLFPGTSEADQMCRICKVLGTPTKENWSEGMTMVSQMQFKFPKCAPVPWSHVLPPGTSKAGVQLIQELLQYDPSRRLTATQALQHRYFDQPIPRPPLTTSETGTVAQAHVAPLMSAQSLKADFKSSSSAAYGTTYGGKKTSDETSSHSETSGRWTRKDTGLGATESSNLGSSRKTSNSPPAYDMTSSTSSSNAASSTWQSSKQIVDKRFVHTPRENDLAADAKPSSRDSRVTGATKQATRKATGAGRDSEGYYSARKFSPSPEEQDESDALGDDDDDEGDEGDCVRRSNGDRPRPLRKRSEDHMLQDLLDEFIA